MTRTTRHARPTAGHRGAIVATRPGATLVEVLMSLMIIGLGLTSVFTLFPMSIVRSIKGTNLTNATLLAHNARDFYIAERTRIDIAPNRTTPDPDNDPDTLNGDLFLTSSPAIDRRLLPSTADDFVGTYVFDPFGGYSANAYGQAPGRFGHPSNGSYGYDDSMEGSEVLRVSNGLGVNDVSSWDSWITDFEGYITSINSTQIQLDPAQDISGTVGANSRVQVLSWDGRRSVTRQINLDPGETYGSVIGLASPLPYDLDEQDEVSLVRIQNYERRYTWLITIHINPSGIQTAQIVAFFRRQLGEVEETYNVSFPTTGNGRQITLATPAGANPKPGDYIFGTWREAHPRISGLQTRNGRWYRITAVSEAGGRTTLTLDRTWVGERNAFNRPKVMFPREIIGVYDIQ